MKKNLIRDILRPAVAAFLVALIPMSCGEYVNNEQGVSSAQTDKKVERSPLTEESRPMLSDVKEFVTDPIPTAPSEHFKEFKITQKDFENVLNNYFQVEEEIWKHRYSHVASGDRTGHIILKDGHKVKWMVRPGGLAWLEFPSGKRMYLAGENTE